MRPTALCLPFALLAAACGARKEPAPANLVVIVVDTLRADHAGAQVMPAVETLARDGVRFERAFCHSPATLPSHASLFSSLHPFENDVKVNAQPLPAALTVLPDWLARLGYRSSAVVSLATLWPLEPRTSLDRSFDEYVYDGQVDCWPAERVTDELEKQLDELTGRGKPFLLFAHYSDPHDPYNAHGTAESYVDVRLDGEPFERLLVSEFGFVRVPVELAAGEHEIVFEAPEPFRVRLLETRSAAGLLPVQWQQGGPHQDLTRISASFSNPSSGPLLCELWLWLQDTLSDEENRARYRLESGHTDIHVGRLLETLRRRGLYDSSLIVFTSDHGEALAEHGLTGHVATLYDELLHVPLIVKPPAGSPHVERLRAAAGRQVRLIDVMPTALELLGLPALPNARGTSLLAGGAPEPLLAETHAPLAPRTLFCLRDERFKLIYHPPAKHDSGDGRFELYDLTADARELQDLFEQRGTEFAQWQAELRRVAEQSAARGTMTPVLDAQAAARLKALGY
jgi:arylsulfatase A-like enzyme